MRTAAPTERGRSRRLAFVAAAAVVVVVLGVAVGPGVWHWATADRTVAQRTGVSNALYQDVTRFRGSDGLYDLPELGATGHSLPSQVHATYLAARILGARFAHTLTVQAKDTLAAFARTNPAQTVFVLEADVALKAAADNRWHLGESVAKREAMRFPASINEANVSEYLAVLEPANLLDPKIGKRTLEAFDPGSDPSAQRIAASSLALSYLFANQSSVRAMFSTLQTQMVGWLASPRMPLPQLLISGVALESSSIISLTTEQLDRFGTRVRGLRGCKGASALFSVDGTHSSACSFTMTAIAGALPG